MVNVSDILYGGFVDACNERDDEPEEVLERLMVAYVDSDETLHEFLDDDSEEPARTLRGYTPEDSQPIGHGAIEALADRQEPTRVDPDDVPDDEIPQNKDVKRALVLACVRHWYDQTVENDREKVVRRDDVAAISEELGLLERRTDYREDEYVDGVMEMMIRNPNPDDDSTAWLSPGDAVDYLDSLDPDDGRIEDEHAVYYLAPYLAEQYDVDEDRINNILERWSLSGMTV